MSGRPRFRFAYSTNAYTRTWTLAEALRDIARAGFDGAEILAEEPHLVPGRDAGVRELVRDLGLGLSNLNANSFFVLGPDENVRTIERCLQMASLLGAPCVSVSTGPLPAGMGAAEARAKAVLSRLGARARALGVRLGVEFEPGHWLDSAARLAAFLDRLGEPGVGANLDVGHVVVAGEDAGEAARRLAGRIWNVHLEDIRGRLHEHLIPGRGEMDFRAVFAALASADYDGYLTLELYPYVDEPDRAGREGLGHLRAIAAALP